MISVPLLQSPISSSRQGRPGDDARICLPQNHDSGQGKVFEAHEKKEFEAFSYTQGPLEPQQLTCIRPAPVPSTTQSRANQMLNPGHVQLEFQSELPSPIRSNPKKKTDSDEYKSQVVAVNTSQTSQNDGCEGLDNDSNVGHDVPVDGVGNGFVQPFDAFEERILFDLDLDQQDCGGLCDAARAVDRFQDEPISAPKVMPTASVASSEASGPAANMVEIKSAVSLLKKGNLQDCHVDIEQQNPDGILCQDSSLNLTLPRIAGLNNVDPPPRPGAGLARGDQTDLDETVQPPQAGGNPTPRRAAGRVSASVSAGPNPAGLAVADHDNHERDASSFATATATTSSFVSVITSSSASLHNDYSKPYDDSCNKTMKNQYLTYLESTTLNIKPSDDTIANPDDKDDDTDKDDRLALSSAGVEVRIRDQSRPENRNQQSKPNNKTTGTATTTTITRAQKMNIKHFPHSPSKIDVINVQDTIIDATTGSSGSNQEKNETNATSAASDVVPLFSNNNQCSSVVKVGLGNNFFSLLVKIDYRFL